jgi:hypothetical protein
MTVAQEASKQTLDKFLLADDDLADFRDERLHPLARLLDLTVCLLCKNTHVKYRRGKVDRVFTS